MSDRLRLRRQLYDALPRSRRGRRALRRQIAILAGGPPIEGLDGGAAGVREPRRPLPGAGPAAMALPLPEA